MSILLFPEFNLQLDGHFEVGGFRVFSHRKESLLMRLKNFLRKLLRTGPRDHTDWRWGLVSTHERLKEIVSNYASSK